MKTPKERKLEKQMMLQESRKDMIERLNKRIKMSNTIINPKSCGYGCNTRIYWDIAL